MALMMGLKIGWRFRDTVLEILNKHLSSTPIHAEEIDMSSSHNNCRIIALFYEDEIQDTDHNPLCELNNLCSQKQKNCQSAAHEIVKAIESASEEFENTVLDDFTILVNTPIKVCPY